MMISRTRPYRFLIDIIYPNRCALCDKVISWDGLICKKCEKEARLVNEPMSIPVVREAFCAFKYEGKAKERVLELKYKGTASTFQEYCSLHLCELLRDSGASEDIDLVTSVPMHIAKKKERGYNQADRIARNVADILGKPCDLKLLQRSADKGEQHKLYAKDRHSHAMQVFSPADSHRDIRGQAILLCDDISTTGSTAQVCAEILRSMGAESVYFCSLTATLGGASADDSSAVEKDKAP